MAPKTSWHGYGTELRHCYSIYSSCIHVHFKGTVHSEGLRTPVLSSCAVDVPIAMHAFRTPVRELQYEQFRWYTCAAVPPRPQDGTVSVIVLFTIVSSCVTDCNFQYCV